MDVFIYELKSDLQERELLNNQDKKKEYVINILKKEGLDETITSKLYDIAHNEKDCSHHLSHVLSYLGIDSSNNSQLKNIEVT